MSENSEAEHVATVYSLRVTGRQNPRLVDLKQEYTWNK